jgi:hypothetical protein
MNLLSVSTDLTVYERERSLARSRDARAADHPRSMYLDLRFGRVSLGVEGRGTPGRTSQPLGLSAAR